jgi:hypothetical protein
VLAMGYRLAGVAPSPAAVTGQLSIPNSIWPVMRLFMNQQDGVSPIQFESRTMASVCNDMNDCKRENSSA